MKLSIKTLSSYILSLCCLNSCSQIQIADKPYVIWGEEIILSTSNNNSRHLQLIEPESSHTAEACILIVHGMNEHIGRYAEIAHYFSSRYIVAGIDLTAHGLSNPVFYNIQKELKAGAIKNDVSDAFLEQAILSDLQPMRDDLEQALIYLIHRCDQNSDNSYIPIFILSHSLGSLVSASYLLQTDNHKLKDRVRGIIFTGPAFSVTKVPGWQGWLQNLFINISYHTHTHFLNPHNEALPLLLFNQILALITVPIQDGIIEFLSLPGLRQLFSPTTPDWVIQYLSNWEEERERHKADPYIIRRSILRYVLGVEKEIIQFRNNMNQFDIPYLLIYSEHDPITPVWGNVDFVKATKQNHSENKVMMLPGENHHEQLFSTPKLRYQVLNRISAWIESRILEN